MRAIDWAHADIPHDNRRNAPAARRVWRRAAGLCGLALLLLAWAGCGRAQHANPAPQDGFNVTFITEPAAPVVGTGVVVVTLRDPAGQPVDGAQLEIEANMNHAGMVPVPGSATGGQGGVYRVPLKWSMSGDWFVDIKFALPDGSRVARRFPVRVTLK